MICDMIVKSIRFRTKYGVGRLISHLQNGTENDAVSFLSGTPADIADMHADARERHSKYSIRHWIVSPHEATSRVQMREVVAMIANEFDFNIERAVIVEHKKSRASADAYDTHWHILVGEVNPVSRKLLRCSFDRIIHELIARWAEYNFGHSFVPGKHTASVVAGLRKRSAFNAASAVEAVLDDRECVQGEAFTHNQHQACKRAGTDLPSVRLAVKRAVATATKRAELETALAALSLHVAPGDKPGIWVVKDNRGEFIGSLARLAGGRKSQITEIMGVEDEPARRKTDNPPGNSDRSASHSQLVGTSVPTRNGGAGTVDSDTEQNLGSIGKCNEPDRTPEPEIGFPQVVSVKARVWLSSVHRHSDQLSLLLGKANVLAMPPAERIAASLWEIEEQARFDFNRKLPDVSYSQRAASLRTEVVETERTVSKKWDALFDVERKLGKLGRPKWWHYLLGIAFVVNRQQKQLTVVATQASDDLESCQRRLEAAKTTLRRQEFQDRQRHIASVEDVVKRKQAAGPILEQVDVANRIIRQNPAIAACGLDFIFARARLRIDDEKRAEAKLAKGLDTGGIDYKR